MLSFETSRPSLEVIESTMNPLLIKIISVLDVERTKKSKDTRDTLGLYMTALYAVFKTMQMKKIFIEDGVNENAKLYKESRKEHEQHFNNFYMTTMIDTPAMIDLCFILDKYQFLIISKNNILDFTNHISIIASSGGTPDIVRDYTSLINLPDMKLLRNIVKDSIIGDVGSSKISNVNYLTSYSKWLTDMVKRNQITAINEGNPNKHIVFSREKFNWQRYLRFEKSDKVTHVCVRFGSAKEFIPDSVSESNATDLESAHNVVPIVIVKNSKTGITLVHPKNGYIVLKLSDLSELDETSASLDLTFSKHIDAIHAYLFSIPEEMTESQIFTTVEKPADFEIQFVDRRRPLPVAEVIDMLKVQHLTLSGKFDTLDAYLRQFKINVYDDSRNQWRYPYRDNFYLPMLHNMNADKIGQLSIIQNDLLVFDDTSNYQFYNSHSIMEFYKEHITELYKAVEHVALPQNVFDIMQRLRVLSGDLVDYVKEEENRSYSFYGSNKDSTKNSIELSWGFLDKKCNFTSSAGDVDSLTNDGKFVFRFNDSSDNKIIYDDTTKQVSVNNYTFMNESELNNAVRKLEGMNKLKNAQMVKNMMYYAKGIPEFIIGINSDFSSGIIAFLPKNTEYYDRYFYDHPWTEMDKQESEGGKYYDLANMSDSIENFTWVTFDTDVFNSAIPITGSTINSESDNYMLSFTLFCEHLLLQGKHELFNLLIPQLVSCYYVVSDSRSKYRDDVVNETHKKFINFILEREYIISPYRYYYLNKLKLLVQGSYDLMTLYEFLKRQEYYAPAFGKFDDVMDLMESAETNKFDMQFYKQWTHEYDMIIKSAKPLKKPDLVSAVKKILDNMKSQNITEHLLDVSQIAKYPNMMAYLCDKKNFEPMVNSLQFTVLQSVENILENLVKDETEIIGNIKYFINQTFDHSLTDGVSNYVKLFELITGKILDKIQYDFVVNMLKDDNRGIYNVYELLMGRGKTFVIIPCTMFCYMMMGSYYNIINCLPTHLVNQSMKVLNKISPFLINGSIVRAKSDRNSPLNTSLSTLIDLTARKIICIDDSSLKSYLLSKAESKPLKKPNKTEHTTKSTILEGGSKRVMTKMNNAIIKGMTGGMYIDIDSVQSVLMEIIGKQNKKTNQNMMSRMGTFNKESYSPLRDNTLILMDEFDSLADPLKSDLNYPYGTQKNLDHQIILNKLVVSVTEMIFIKYRNYMLYSDRADNKINKLMIRSIMNNLDHEKYAIIHQIYTELTQKLRESNNDAPIEQFVLLGSSETTEISRYQKGGSKTKRTQKNQHGGSKLSLMMFFIREVYTTYIMCMEMMLDKDYGWDDTAQNPFVVIPYSAQKTPMKGSKFSSPIINIVLTAISYFSKPFRTIDSQELTEYLRFLVNSSSKDYVISEKNLDTKGISIALMKDDKAFSYFMQDLKISNPEMYHNYIRVYLEELILMKYVTVDPNIYNCSFIDVIDPNFIKSKFALSGTVNVHLPEFKYYGENNKLSFVVEDHITKEKIERVLIGVDEIGKPTSAVTLMLEDLAVPEDIRNSGDLPVAVGKIINNLDDGNYNIAYSIIALLGNDDNESKNYNVLIDVGSFLRNYENQEFALMVSHFYKDRHIIFFDSNDQPMAMFNTKIVPFDMKSLKHDLKTKIIFDQKHTVGTDLDLHSTSRGILTVNNMTTRSPLVQGAYRFREADLNQKITYLAKDIRQTTDELIDGINNREKQTFARSEIKFYQQTILCLLRRYDQYTRESYQFRAFVPSIEMSDQIFVKGNYGHDYKKEEFTKYVNSCLDNVDKYVSELTGDQNSDQNKNPMTAQYKADTQRSLIKAEILAYLDLVNKSEVEDNSVMVQKQTNIQKEKNYQSETEANNARKGFDLKSVSFEKISVYDLDLKPTTIATQVNFGEAIENDPLMQHLKKLKINMSPNAAHSVCKTYNKGETDDLFYLAFIGSDAAPSVMLYTSVDIIILYSHNKEMIKDLVRVDKFMIDGSLKSFYQNFIMFLLLKIPNTKTMIYVESDELLKEIAPIIGLHYKDTFRYNIKSISKRFADFVGLE